MWIDWSHLLLMDQRPLTYAYHDGSVSKKPHLNTYTHASASSDLKAWTSILKPIAATETDGERIRYTKDISWSRSMINQYEFGQSRRDESENDNQKTAKRMGKEIWFEIALAIINKFTLYSYLMHFFSFNFLNWILDLLFIIKSVRNDLETNFGCLQTIKPTFEFKTSWNKQQIIYWLELDEAKSWIRPRARLMRLHASNDACSASAISNNQLLINSARQRQDEHVFFIPFHLTIRRNFINGAAEHCLCVTMLGHYTHASCKRHARCKRLTQWPPVWQQTTTEKVFCHKYQFTCVVKSQ